MSLEIRTCVREEMSRALAPISHFFGRSPAEERTERFLHVFEPERMHAAFEGQEIVGGAGAFSFELTVPGARVPAAGVTVVGVLPTHRRRGILTELTRAQLDDIRARGEPLACLWASEETIYGRYGYGMASLAGELELPRRYGAFREPVAAGQARIVGVEEALELLPPVYERVAKATPGMFSRPREWWETRTLSDEGFAWAAPGEQLRVVLESDGRPTAYALYRVSQSFAGGSSSGVVHVLEAMGETPGATAAIWRYLLDVDWLDRVQASLLPVDHPLFFLLVEPRRMGFRVGDGVWVRLVDVEAALARRSYRGDEELVLQVNDAFCPWNEGRYRVGSGGVGRTEDPAELRLAVDALGSVYLGGFTFAQLARGGLVDELLPGAIERADSVFHTDRAPWCPEIF